jgi:glyoxylase-like metal-dependent hydrolase (beta-lactamase superfamily II)
MQQIAAGIAVATSRYWQTNSGLIRTEDGIVLVDAGVLPSEMRNLATACDGSPIIAGISTHEHWDHLLWSAALGVDVPRYASSDTVDAAIADRAALLRRIEREEEDWGVCWDRDLFGRTVAHDVGTLNHDVAPALQLINLPGHTPGQIGVWVGGADVLFVGDTVSDIDPPALPGDRAAARTYLKTLRRMIDLVGDARVVVPGHGTPCDAVEAKLRLARDRRYLDVLLDTVEGEHASLDVHSVSARIAAVVDDARLDTPGGRQLHIENVTDLLRAR